MKIPIYRCIQIIVNAISLIYGEKNEVFAKIIRFIQV